MRVEKLEGELNKERHTKRQVEKLSNTRKLQIKFTIVQHFKDSMYYQDKLIEYATVAYVNYTNDMIKLVAERRVEPVVTILAEAKNSYRAHASSA